ncbi:MAG: hypothetical protein ACLFN7_04945 [Candidatus Acetothermia bacterium]
MKFEDNLDSFNQDAAVSLSGAPSVSISTSIGTTSQMTGAPAPTVSLL